MEGIAQPKIYDRKFQSIMKSRIFISSSRIDYVFLTCQFILILNYKLLEYVTHLIILNADADI